MDSDEEERLQRWKEHLASEAYEDEHDGLIPPGHRSDEGEEDEEDSFSPSGRAGEGGFPPTAKTNARW